MAVQVNVSPKPVTTPVVQADGYESCTVQSASEATAVKYPASFIKSALDEVVEATVSPDPPYVVPSYDMLKV